MSPLLDLPSTPVRGGGGGGTLLELPMTPQHSAAPADAAEASNMAAIRDLCRAIAGHGFLDCPQRHVRSLALEAMFLLVPDPSFKDPEVQDMWAEVQHKMEACPSSLPEPSLVHLVTSLMARVECSEASRDAIVPAALAIAESFVRQVPSDAMGRALVQAWMQCLSYGPQCREVVLQSVYRTLDAPLPDAARAPASGAHHAGGSGSAAGGGDWLGGGGGVSGGGGDFPRLRRSLSMSHRRRYSGSFARTRTSSGLLRRRPSSSMTELFAAMQLADCAAAERRHGGRGSTILLGGGAAAAAAANPDAVSAARGAVRRLQRLALWFIGEYCCELVGLPPPRRHQVVPPPGATPVAPTEALLAMTSRGTVAVPPGDPCGWLQEPPGGGGGGTPPVSHPVTGAMNATAAALAMRLKAAALFEDAQTRHSAVSALCFLALRLPEPTRFDAYLFLRALCACEFDPAEPAPCCGGMPGGAGGGPLKAYVDAQAAACEALGNAPAFGLAEVALPVLTYLDMLYGARAAAAAGGAAAASSYAANAPALQELRSVLDPAAAGS